LFPEDACRAGIEGMKVGPGKQQIVELLGACIKARCPSFEEPRPPLCGTKIEVEGLTQSTVNEWVRFAGATIAIKRQIPRSWAHSVAGMMASDWNLSEDPSFLGPQGKLREPELKALLARPNAEGFVLEIIPISGGEPIGTWKVTHNPMNNDVEAAIESVESKVRGRVVGVEPSDGTPFMSIARVSTALRVFGAMDIPLFVSPGPSKTPAKTAGDAPPDAVPLGDGPVPLDQPDGGPES